MLEVICVESYREDESGALKESLRLLIRTDDDGLLIDESSEVYLWRAKSDARSVMIGLHNWRRDSMRVATLNNPNTRLTRTYKFVKLIQQY